MGTILSPCQQNYSDVTKSQTISIMWIALGYLFLSFSLLCLLVDVCLTSSKTWFQIKILAVPHRGQFNLKIAGDREDKVNKIVRLKIATWCYLMFLLFKKVTRIIFQFSYEESHALREGTFVSSSLHCWSAEKMQKITITG